MCNMLCNLIQGKTRYCIREFLTAEGVLQQQVVEHSSDEEKTISVRTGRQTLDIVEMLLEQREFTTENNVTYSTYANLLTN